MAYIPKNRIETGLYTKGQIPEPLFKTKDNEIYTGQYYRLYNGKFYSGKNQNDPSSVEIYPASDDGTIIKKDDNNKSIPLSPLFPTSQDYKNGFFTRYFSIRRNQALFLEIDKETYDKFQQKKLDTPWQLYRVFSLKWELTGDVNKVAQTNKNVTILVEQKENNYGLSLFLKENWTQYYKANP